MNSPSSRLTLNSWIAIASLVIIASLSIQQALFSCKNNTVNSTVKNNIMVDCVALTKKYFEVWNAHDVAGIQALHAATSSLADWDASHGPTNAAVAAGIGKRG